MSALTRLVLLSAAVVLGACTQSVMVNPAGDGREAPPPARESNESAPTYTVQPGDTLYKISVQYGVDYRDLAQWNGIAAPYTIYPKQRLRVGAGSVVAAAAPSTNTAPVSTPMQPPADGESIGGDVANAASPTTAVASAPGYNANLGVTLPDGAEPLAPSSPAASSVTSATATASTAAAANPVFEDASSSVPAAATTAASASAAAMVAPAATTSTPATTNTPAPLPPAAVTPTVTAVPANDVAASKPSAAGWIWPTPGKVVVTYAGGDPTRQGIDITGDFGQPVKAARDGEVVYSGAGLIGYGELVIIKHSPELLSAYGHNRVRLVKEGDKVKAGQKIAEMGKNASNRVLLHFEVRKNGKPVDPQPLLPVR